MSETRKLAAILVADIVGYSRLTRADASRPAAEVVITRSDAAKAGGTKSDLVIAKLVREATAAIGDGEVAVRETARCPRGVKARRMIALDSLAVETLALARATATSCNGRPA
jgi:hypothetical protein